MPSLVRVATGMTSPIVGGLIVSALTFSGAIAVLSLRNASVRRILSGGIPALVAGVAITLAGVQTQHMSLMLVGTIVAGIGFGAAFSGSMRTVMPHAEAHERAGLLSAFYVEGSCRSASRPSSPAWWRPSPACRWPPTSMAPW
jgi:hypothetical protein